MEEKKLEERIAELEKKSEEAIKKLEQEKIELEAKLKEKENTINELRISNMSNKLGNKSNEDDEKTEFEFLW